MPKKSKKDETVYFTDEELAEMTPQQKLKRVADLQNEIETHRQNLKDTRAATRDLIDEMKEKMRVLLESVPRE